jgi:RNA polymerase sigma factor (sigma-70 family)
MNLSDEALMTAVREGDVQQLTLLFERYQKPLFDFFGRMNGTRAGSDDMVQDVFFRILKYRATFRNENRFRPWLYQIARNVRTDHSKSDFGPEDPRVSDAGTFSSDSPVYRLEQDEDAAILRCALGMLSDEKRELLVLVWYQEMKYQDIADLLGIDVGAVKVRVHRAVKELRRGFDRISSEKSSCNVKKFRII